MITIRLMILPLLILVAPFAHVVTARQASATQERQLRRGAAVRIENPFGGIVIRGWDRDVVQANVEGLAGESTAIRIDDLSAGGLLVRPAAEARHAKGIALKVSLPTYAAIETIATTDGDVEIEGMGGPVEVKSGSGNVRISRVAGATKVNTASGDINVDRVPSLQVNSQSGDVTLSNLGGGAMVGTSGRLDARNVAGDVIVRTESGSVTLDNIAGQLDIVMSSGSLKVFNAGGNIQAVTIGGSINLQCVQGNVEASTVTGSITLSGIHGDVSARTTSGGLRLTTAMRESGRYTMKSLSGSVRMFVEGEAPGFNGTLSSHSGRIETDYSLSVAGTTVEPTPENRRIVGRYGDGRAQIELDSFEGSVGLNRTAAGANQTCPK
jgi:DUF4097 and DUF4098 domain-containing protein YvlB